MLIVIVLRIGERGYISNNGGVIVITAPVLIGEQPFKY
jgi:hypothetical protein